MDYDTAKQALSRYGQLHLLNYYGELSADERRILLSDIKKVNFSVLENINNNGAEKSTGEIGPANAKNLEDISKNRQKYEEEGLKLLRGNKVGAVLLAGGQGTRLGFDKPKGTFDMGETRFISIFELQMNEIKAVARRSGVNFPLFIMTSEINHDETVKFFRDNAFFGYPESKIFFYIQDTEPVCDFNGKIFLSDKHRVALSPNGNGGWYSSLVNGGLNKVIEREGLEWLNVYSVDNVLQKICDPAFIGAVSLSGCNCGSKVVKKTSPEEKVGVLCERNKKPCVVEYYEMPSDLAQKRDKDGELVYCYGVTLNYLFKINSLDETLKNKLPYHLAKKAVPHIKDGVKVTPSEPNGYKFETLVVDMISDMGSCLAFEVEREKEFAPVKNKTGADSVETARALLKINGISI